MSQLPNLSNWPDKPKKYIIEQFSKWQNYNPTSLDDAKKSVSESFIYSLRMFWQRRFDKLNKDDIQSFDLISFNDDILHKKYFYGGVGKAGDVLIVADDHTVVATEVFNALWELYIHTPDVPLPVVPVKKSWMDKVKTSFNSIRF